MRIVKTLEFARWINDLRDSVGKAQIITRVGRLADGNPGDHRYLTSTQTRDVLRAIALAESFEE